MFDPVLPLAHLNQRVRVNARVLGPSDAHKSALHPCSASGRATSLMWGAHTPTRAAGNVHGRGLITVVRAQVAIKKGGGVDKPVAGDDKGKGDKDKDKGRTFSAKEKRKRDLGQSSRDKNWVEEEKRILREAGGGW